MTLLPNSSANACDSLNSNGSRRERLAEFATSSTKRVPGRLVTGPVICGMPFSSSSQPLAYLARSTRPRMSGDSSPALNVVVIGATFATSVPHRQPLVFLEASGRVLLRVGAHGAQQRLLVLLVEQLHLRGRLRQRLAHVQGQRDRDGVAELRVVDVGVFDAAHIPDAQHRSISQDRFTFDLVLALAVVQHLHE